MALPKQIVPYNFGFGGTDQGIDDRFVPLGRPKELRNVRFPKQGRISRRGQFGTPTGTTATAVILKKMFSVGDAGLLGYGIDANGVSRWYTNEPSTGTLVAAGRTNFPVENSAVPRAWMKSPAAIDQGVLGSLFVRSVSCDVAAGTSHSCYVARRSLAGLDWFIIDEKTNDVLANGSIGSGTDFSNIRVLAIPGSDNFVIAGATAVGTIVVYTVSVATALTLRATIASVSVAGRWDWAMYTSALYVASHSSATPTRIVLTKFDTSTWATSSANIDLGVSPLAIGVVVPYTPGATRITVLAHEGTNGLRGVSYNSALAVTTPLWVINASTTTLNYVAAAELSDGLLDVWDEQNNATAYLILVRQYGVTVGSGGGAITTMRNARLASKPIVTSLYRSYALLGYTSNDGLQHSLFLAGASQDATGLVAARFSLGGWKGSITGYALPNLQAFLDSGVTTTMFFGAQQTIGRIYADQDASQNVDIRTSAAWFDTNPANGFVVVDDENTKLITGGYLSVFDGSRIVENGFLLAPEIVSATGTGGGGMPASGTYLFKAVFAYPDARGRIHRSAASQPFSGTTNGAQGSANVVVRGMSFSRRNTISLELYRTTNGGTVYYLVDIVTFSTPGSDNITVSSSGSDTALVANTPLYQQGTILGNHQPSCPIAIASTGRRVHVTPGDDMQAITEGKERVEGEGAAFFEGVERRITLGGDIEALSTSGDRWVAFKKRAMFFAGGEGADDSGQNDTLTQFEQFSSDVGCALPTSIVTTAYGTVFRAERGFFLLARDGGLVYLGAGVEDDVETVTAGARITDSAYNKDAGTIHFQTTDSECYVLTLFQAEGGYEWRWSVDDSMAFVGLAFTGGRLYASRSTSQTTPIQRYEPSGVYTGGSGQSFDMRIRTAWIAFAGNQQARGRLYRILALGRSSSTALLLCKIAYDFIETFTQTSTANAAVIGAAFQWNFTMNRQKAQVALLEFSQSGSFSGADVELNQLLLEIGVQPAAAKLASNKVAS